MLLTKSAVCLIFAAFAIFAQTANAQDSRPNSDAQINKASYEVRLQLLVSSNTQANNKLPENLQPIEKKLREDFAANNYQLALTLLNRTTENAFIDVKGVNSYQQTQSSTQAPDASPTFYNFNIIGIKPNSAKPGELSIANLQFGLRIPIAQTTINEGKSFSTVSYEQIGISAKPLSIALNEPTVVGTLTTSRPNELIVLVLTVKSSDNSDSTRTARKN